MKEGIIQKQIIGYLKGRKDLFFYRSNNMGVWDPKTKGFRNPPPGFVAGIPDITIIKDGKHIGIELKRDEVYKRDCKGGKVGEYKYKQSEDQEKAEEQIKANGGYYYVIRSLEELVEVL